MRTLGIGVAGRIPEAAGAQPGRALARLGGVGWGNRLRPLVAQGAPDAPVSEDLVAAAVRVLAGWGWRQRPAAVVTVASRSRPQLVASLGEQIAAIGRLPLLGQVERIVDDRSAYRMHNSAHRLASLWEAFAVPGDLGVAVGNLPGPVLLVDDLIVTGWTMTVVARALRHAGAVGVLPFALAVETG